MANAGLARSPIDHGPISADLRALVLRSWPHRRIWRRELPPPPLK